MTWRVEFAPGAARVLRSLPREEQRRVAERIGHLEAGGLPMVGAGGSPADVVMVPAGRHLLGCVPRFGGAILVATIEPASRTLGSLAQVGLGQLGPALRGVREVRVRGASVHGRPPARGDRMMEAMGELAGAFRSLRRRPGVVGLAVLALGLGIGLPASIRAVMDGAFLRGLPVADGRQIMHVERRPHGASGEGWQVAGRDWLVWREGQRSFASLGAFQSRTVAVRAGSGADRYAAAAVTASVFEVLRVPAAVGRTLEAGDDAPGAAPVVVLGHALWRDRFASDPGVPGRTVFVDGVAHTVVGVMPEGFRFPTEEDLWVPLVLDPASGDAGVGLFDVVGRLGAGRSRSEAAAEFAVLAERVAEQYPETNATMGVAVKPFTARYMGETATRQSYVMLGAMLLVLLVASVNAANLQLVRAVERLRDLAVRTALGASRARIVRQLLLESGAIAFLGGLVGVAVAAVAIRGFGLMFPPHRMPYWFDLRLDPGVLLFIGGLSAAAALLAGVLPAVRVSGRNLLDALNDGSRGATGARVGRMMQGLVVLEIAFSLALLVTAGLLLLGVGRVQPHRLGLVVDDVVTARVTLPETYGEEQRRAWWEALARDLADDPAIQDVAIATTLPATHASVTPFAVEGREYPPEARLPRARSVVATGRLFPLFGRPAVRGRGIDEGDRADALPVAVVNERFATVHFEGEDPLGRRIRLSDSGEAPWRTIVGVVPDLWANGLDSAPDRNPPAVYVPLAQAPPGSAAIAVRGAVEPAAAIALVRAAAFRLEREAPVYEAMPMDRLIRDNSWFYGMAASILVVAGAAALVLATAGLYGVIAFSVGRRKREIGIRMAFGASRAGILRLVLRRGAPGLALGMLAGFALAGILARGVATLMFGVSPGDPRVFAAVGAFLALVSLAAMMLPARRAASVDPLEALRRE